MAPPDRWRSDAFGIAVHGAFTAPGLPRATGPAAGPATHVEIVNAGDIDARCAGAPATRLLEERFDDAPEAARSIDHHSGAGYRLFARGFGLALVAEDGSRVWCAPPDDEPWSWQRFLVGRILPWTAVLLGREGFHAGAVVVGGGAVALVGATGAGKSSLTAHMLLGGARFLTDDVLAVDNDDGAPRAHPGAAILSMRHAERTAMGDERWRRLGTLLGDSGKLYVEVPRADAPAPLRALYFMAPGSPGDPPVAPLRRRDFRLLLGSTFNESLQSPQRLRRQFELCADIAAQVPMFDVSVAPGTDAAQLAETVLRHATEAVTQL